MTNRPAASSHRREESRIAAGPLSAQRTEMPLDHANGAVSEIPGRVELPTDRPRSSTLPGIETDSRQLWLSPSVLPDLLRQSKSEETAPFAILLVAYLILLGRYTEQDFFEIKIRIGNEVPMSDTVLADLRGNPSFREVVWRIAGHFLADNLSAVTRITLSHTDNEWNFSVHREKDGLLIRADYSPSLFDSDRIERLLSLYDNLLKTLLRDTNQSVWELDLLTQQEARQQALWNSTSRPYDRDACLHELFAIQAATQPLALAVKYETLTLTYAGLNDRSNRLAHYLQSKGVKAETVIGICAEPSIDMLVGLLGILKAGGAYLPLDPELPLQRFAYILRDSGVNVVLTQARSLARFEDCHDLQIVCLDQQWKEIQRKSEENLSRVTQPDNLAYVIYTSGSTGRPKGAMNTHRAICNRLLWMQEEYGLQANDRVLQKTPLTFDVSVWEFFWPLIAGASLVISKHGEQRDGNYLANLIASEQISTVHFVPSMLNELLSTTDMSSCTSLKRVICSGESLSTHLVKMFFGHLSCELHNLYGPTEAAVDVTYWRCHSDKIGEVIPIGRPVANTKIYILDRNFCRMPVGVPGDLYIGGVQVGRGYYRRPKMTAERFLPNPFSDDSGERLYHTGDRARFLSDGSVAFGGRIDFQVKIRGFRIELEEIESVLKEHPGINKAVVVARKTRKDETVLAAYVVPKLMAKSAVPGCHRLPNGMSVLYQNRGETDFLYQEIFVSQSYLQHGIELADDACVFDVGANIGLFALHVAAKCPAGQVYAFEPLQPIFQTLAGNALLCDADLKIFPIGLSDQETEAELTYYPGNSIMSGRKDAGDRESDIQIFRTFLRTQLPEADFGARADYLVQSSICGEIHNCRLRRLSNVMREEGVERIDLLKIDVERAEWEVLNGIDAEDWSKIQQVVLEVHDRVSGFAGSRVEHIAGFLKDRGYDVIVEEDGALQATGLYNVYAKRFPTDQGFPVAVAPGRKAQGARSSRLRTYLQARLPEYMIPSVFVMMQELPLTPSGKIDRLSLPDPDVARRPSLHYASPASREQELLCALFEEVLDMKSIGIHDNFFELGGHSLLAMRLLARIWKTFHVEMPLRSVFEQPTVATLANELQRQQVSSAKEIAIQRRQPHDRTPLSFSQERIFFLQQLEPEGYHYNEPVVLRIRGNLDSVSLNDAWREIVKRHQVLRTTLQVEGCGVVQHVASPETWKLEFEDMIGVSAARLEERIKEYARRPFDLTLDVPQRTLLLRVREHEHLFLLVLHHITVDARSMEVLASELSELYGRHSSPHEAHLPDLPIQYLDYAAWQREHLHGDLFDKQLDYWREHLNGAPPVLRLTVATQRSASQNNASARTHFVWPASLVQGLHDLRHAHRVTLFTLLLAACSVLLQRYSGEDDLIIGTPISGRNRREVEDLVGLFLNTLALRIDLSGNPTVPQFLRRVREVTLDAYVHQDLPFDKLVEKLQPVREMGRTPLFQIALIVQTSAEPKWELEGLEVEPLAVELGVAKFDLTFDLRESAGQLQGVVEYRTALFREDAIARMVRHLEILLGSMVADTDTRIGELRMLTEQDRGALEGWNATESMYERDASVHRLFEQQVRLTPDAPATSFQGQYLSYQQVNRRANKLAHYLRENGVQLKHLVGICMERSLDFIVSMLAILKAGAGYVPIDPAYPKDRVGYMIDDSQIRIVLTQGTFSSVLHGLKVIVIQLDKQSGDIAKLADSNLDGTTAALDVIYAMYTSGSTGTPKGVMATHRGVLRLVRNTNYVEFSASDIVLHAASPSFDGMTFEIWGALLNGAQLKIFPASMPIAHLDTWVQREQVTIGFLTTSLFQHMVENGVVRHFRGFRQLMVGGEALAADSVDRFLRECPSCRLVNGYGPTEDTTFSICAGLQAVSGKRASVPIGRSVANSYAYVLDEAMNPVPLGLTGELYLGGDGQARGYLGRPGLTAERFVPDPYSAEGGQRLYRTGDIVRRMEDGKLEFVGRVDTQVKIRGFRIELEEIETSLLERADIRDAIVILREDTPGDKRLVAYYVSVDESSVGAHALHSYLATRLPQYMLPAAYVQLQAIPLNPNGKRDRQVLPLPASNAFAMEAYQEAEGGLEMELAAIWREVLKIERVGRHDNFFTLGGDSIRTIVVVSRARQRDIDLSPELMFRYQTIAGQASVLTSPPPAALSSLPKGAPALAPLADRSLLPPDIEHAYTLSGMQLGMIFHNQLAPQLGIYHVVMTYHMRFDDLDVTAFQQVLDAMVRKHPILRTSISLATYSEPLQLVHETANIPLEIRDISNCDFAAQEQMLANWIDEETKTAFQLDRPPLLRICFHRRTANTFQYTLSCHHVILDGWSVASFNTELFREYARLCDGETRELRLQPLALDFSKAIEAEKKALQSPRLTQFWKDFLAEYQGASLPTRAGASHGQFEVSVSDSLRNQLTRLADLLEVPVRTLFLTAHLRVMSMLTGDADVVTGMISHLRPGETDGEKVLGLFLNTLPFRQRMSAGAWSDLIRATFAVELTLMPARFYPYSQILLDTRRNALCDTAFNYVDYHVYDGLRTLNSLEILSEKAFVATNFLLFANVIHRREGIVLQLGFAGERVGGTWVDRIGQYYLSVLESMTRDPSADHTAQSYLSELEIRHLLYEWQGSVVARDSESVAGLFESQVAKSPQAIAVMSGHRTLTYEQLNARANQLARYLIALGVGPDETVGVCVGRSIDMVVALLGVLKAGGAYVPLDPTYPAARLAYMLKDSRPPAVIVDESARNRLPNFAGSLVDLNDSSVLAHSASTPPRRLSPHHLAYLIYTSGSTGRPKGVMIEQRSVVEFLHWASETFTASAMACVMASTSLSFDLSLFEIFAPLVSGGSVLVVRDVLQLVSAGASQQATLINTVPSALAEVIRAGVSLPAAIKVINVAGEAIPSGLIEQVLQNNPQLEAIYNLYGPTEDTTYSTYHRMTFGGNQIGRSITNSQAYVLDEDGMLLPVGVTGELYLGGNGLARGYLGKPRLTAERFVPNPLSGRPGERLYRTGDLCRWTAEGTLEFLGRKDEQVKVRGHRIELGEIATALEATGIDKAVVVVREDRPGDKQLVAYVTGAEGLDMNNVRSQLRETLPDYMVPSLLVKLVQFPLTANGKVDRSALPTPEAPGSRSALPPTSPLEHLVAQTWAEVLGLGQIDLDQNFFDLGGDSLLAVRIIARLRAALKVEVPMEALFVDETLQAFAKTIQELMHPSAVHEA